jgi:hypothetical protein
MLSIALKIKTDYLSILLTALVHRVAITCGEVYEVKPSPDRADKFARVNGRLIELVASKSPVYGLSGDPPINASFCAILALAGMI